MPNPNAHVDPHNPFAVTSAGMIAANAEDTERLAFIRKTYAHLTGAVLALIALEMVLFTAVPKETMELLVSRMLSGYGWLVVLAIFMGVSWMARSWASGGQSRTMQYAGLGLYVAAQAVILLPMLYICIRVMGEPNLPIMAAAITAMCFMGLTAFVFTSRVDLAGWGKYLAIAGIVALGAIVVSIFTGFTLGLGFCSLMVALSCGYILYDTSNVLHHYRTGEYVAASLALFASVVLLYWYVLRLLMFSRD